MKILIVEDEKLLAESLKTLLVSKGFQVEAVYDGETGAEYALLGIYDLLILDVMIPENKPPPGTVTIKLDKAGNQALLTVENLGTPLTQEEVKNIFRRFYRADPSRSCNGSYGLGLSIAQKITVQHGGKIWAEGTPAGNRFSVLIPLSHRENSNAITE